MGSVRPRGALRRTLASIWQLLRDHPGYAGLCILAAAEAAINAYFGWHYFKGESYDVSLIMAALLLGNEMVKWQAADRFGEALAASDTWRATGSAVIAVCCLSISIPAHIGFIGMLRADTAAAREAQADQGSASRQQLARALDEQQKLGTQRPVDAVAAERKLECSRTSKSFPNGEGPRCTALKSEEAAAQRAVELAALIPTLQGQRLATGGVAQGDAQVRVFGWIFSKAKDDDIKLALSVALALAAEIITTLGFAVFGGAQSRRGPDLEALVAAGVVTPEVVTSIVPFRNDVLTVGGAASEEEIWAAYATWARARGAEPMRRDVFVRLLAGIGMRFDRGMLLGWSVRRAA